MKRKIRISEEELTRIIRESIEKYKKGLYEGSPIARFDNPVKDISVFVKDMNGEREFDYSAIPLNEGLICTYPIEKVSSIVKHRFGLFDNQFLVDFTFDNGTVTHIVSIVLDKNVTANLLGEITNLMRACGYYRIKKPKYDAQSETVGLVFEPMFTDDVSDYIHTRELDLFHLTHKNLIQKIKKNGIIPKSKNAEFDYPDRIYLFIGKDLDSDQISVAKNVIKSKGPDKSTDEFCLVRIDPTKLNNNVRFFSDHMSRGAVFTYDNIPPTAISGFEKMTI